MKEIAKRVDQVTLLIKTEGDMFREIDEKISSFKEEINNLRKKRKEFISALENTKISDKKSLTNIKIELIEIEKMFRKKEETLISLLKEKIKKVSDNKMKSTVIIKRNIYDSIESLGKIGRI